MTTKTPEEVLAILVSGLLTERRFSISSPGDTNERYTLHITTVSRNQGRVLGAGRSNLNAIKTLMSEFDPDIEVVLEDPDETTPISDVVTKSGLDAAKAWLELTCGDGATVTEDAKKIVFNGGDISHSAKTAATNLFFAIGRAQGKYAEVVFE